MPSPDRYEQYNVHISGAPSSRMEYGGHWFDDHGPLLHPMRPNVAQSWGYDYGEQRFPSVPMTRMEHHTYHNVNSKHNEYSLPALPLQNHQKYTYCKPLPSRPRNIVSDNINYNPRHQASHRSTSGPKLTSSKLFPATRLPILTVSEHPYNPSESRSFTVSPDDSRSEAARYTSRKSHGSAPPTISTSVHAPSTLPSGSGVLGPKMYQYQPLKDMEFRLVKVLPERMSELKCEILHASFDELPYYTAISYAWGDGIDTKSLVLEGANIPVAVSLYDALAAVRQKKKEVLVWIDALCIDQQNKDERAAQVRLMGHIYSQAVSVAIWLGPEADKSELAVRLLEQVASNLVSAQRIRSTRKYPDSAALLALFQRDYWKRLWVVQEVLLAEKKTVYCGDSVFPWEVYQQAANAFWNKYSDPHIRQGPSSFPDRSELIELGEESLLEVLRACRKKLSENPRDKVFGILGLLSEATQHEINVDYGQSVKKVYTDVVDHLISTTDQLDVIRESIHFPPHANTTGLPKWCPDWSHSPAVSGLSRTLGFDASRATTGPTKALYRFKDGRRKLQVLAVKLDVISATGVAVGTFCSSQDYLTTFLHWHAILLHELNIGEGDESHPAHQAFCRTLCLGQVPEQRSKRKKWHTLCYHVFSSLIREKMPRLPMDEDLDRYVGATGLIEPGARRKFLQDHFGDRMTGRSLCITKQGLIGMGSGYMTAGDLIVVPFGCSTPILLRPEARRNEYSYVGDVYIHHYMHGEAMQQMEANDPRRVVSEYVLC